MAYRELVGGLPSRGPIDSDFAPEMFFGDEDDIEELEDKFSEMQRLYWGLSTSSVQERRPSSALISTVHAFDYDHWVPKLFLGQDWSAKSIDHRYITALLADKEELARCKARRAEYKREFLGGSARQNLTLPYGVWVVLRDVELPFMIPVDLFWFNSRTVNPDTATWSELYNAGRIVDANTMLYEKNRFYAPLLQRLIALEQYVVDAEVFTEWHSGRLMWYKPLHRTVITRVDEKLGWSMFLAVPRAIVEQNMDRVIIRKGAVLASFAGEMKVLDMFEADNYALGYIGKHDDAGDALTTHLVCTKAELPDRPGVCNFAFFSNHCCVETTGVAKPRRKPAEQQQWFANTHSDLAPFRRIGGELSSIKRTSNIVLGASELYKHETLSVTVNITGRMFAERELCCDQWPMMRSDEEMMYVPVEWNYYLMPPGEGPRCTCLSRCYFSAEAERGRAPFTEPQIETRPPPAMWTLEKAEAELSGSLSALKLSCIRKFFAQQPQ